MSDADSSKRFRKRRVRQFARRGYVYSWRRVYRDVDADAVARAGTAPKPKYPSRISPNWRPQVVEPLPGIPPSSPEAISAGTSGREVGAGSGKTEEEGLS